VNNNDCLLIHGRNCLHQVVATVPRVEVVAVTGIALNGDVAVGIFSYETSGWTNYRTYPSPESALMKTMAVSAAAAAEAPEVASSVVLVTRLVPSAEAFVLMASSGATRYFYHQFFLLLVSLMNAPIAGDLLGTEPYHYPNPWPKYPCRNCDHCKRWDQQD
jgi:hypothetical protein